jgi:hypothetical protein
MNLHNEDIPSLINKKDYFKILNKFEIVKDKYNDKFNVNVYYLEDNLCKIIIRRTDVSNGWGKDLKIILYSEDEKNNEIISVGSSELNTKIIDMYVDIILIKKIMNYTIDKKIIQLYDKKNIDNFENYLIFTNIIDNNINLDYIHFNEQEQRMFIKTNCNEYLDTYDLLKEKDMKNMIFICNYLYLNGGYYLSFNIELNKNITDFSDKNYYIINNNLILELLFCTKDNKNIMTYLDQLLYLNSNMIVNEIFKDFEKVNTEYYILKTVDDYKIINNNYIKNVFTINQYKFLIDSSTAYNIEYLNLNYYKIDSEYNIEKDLEIIIINNETSLKTSVKINQDNKYHIFKIN